MRRAAFQGKQFVMWRDPLLYLLIFGVMAFVVFVTFLLLRPI